MHKIADILANSNIDPTDNLLRSIFLVYFSSNDNDNNKFCNMIEDKIKNGKYSIEGSSQTKHYRLKITDLDLSFLNENINKLFKKIKHDIYIKQDTFGSLQDEIKFYKELDYYVYSFNTPHFLTILGECSIGLITIAAHIEFYKFLGWRLQFSAPFYKISYNPFDENLYKQVNEKIMQIATEYPPKDIMDLKGHEIETNYLNTLLDYDTNKKYKVLNFKNGDDERLNEIIRNKLKNHNNKKPNENMSIQQFVDIIDNRLYEFNNNIAIFIFQIIYTINILVDIGIIHQDLHLSNILLIGANTQYDYYYIIDDKDTKIVNIKNNILPIIFDFDRAIHFNEMSYTWFMNDNDNTYIKSKFDLKFFLTSLQIICQEKFVLESSINNTINKIMYGMNNNRSQINNVLAGDPVEWRKIDKSSYDKIKDLFSKLMSPNECLKWLISGDPDSIIKSDNEHITYYENLTNIPLTTNSKIFFPLKINKLKLQDQLYQNQNWLNLSSDEKIIVCNPLIKNDDVKNMQTAGYYKYYIKYKSDYLILSS